MTIDPILPLWAIGLVAVAAVVVVVPWRRPRRADAVPVARGLVAAFLLAVLTTQPTLARPVDAHERATRVDVVVVLDTTTSMLAEDQAGGRTRLSAARSDIRRLTRELPGARFALLTFDRRARFDVPLTTDAQAVIAGSEVAVPPMSIYATGTSITEGRAELKPYLARAKRTSPERPRIVVYLGDGEHTAAGPPGSFADLAPYVDEAVVVGYGTEAGGHMRDPDGQGGVGDYIPAPDDYGSRAVSRIDHQALRGLAADLNGAYVHRTDPTALADTIAELRDGAETAAAGDAPARGASLTWLVALALGVWCLGELWLLMWGSLGRRLA